MSTFDYNVEPTLEGALVSLLNLQNVPAGASLTTDTLFTPRVDVRFELGAERSIYLPSGGASDTVANTWEGQFVLSVITDRDANGASHSAFRSTVRQVMAETPAVVWEGALGPRYRLLALNHLSTTYDVLDQDRALDASVMTYAAIIRFL